MKKLLVNNFTVDKYVNKSVNKSVNKFSLTFFKSY